MLQNLLKDCRISRVNNAAAAAQTEVQSSRVDMQADGGWDGVIFVALLGEVTTLSVLGLAAYQHTADAAAGTAVTGASAAKTASGNDSDNGLLAVEVVRPTKRYVWASLTRTTADAVVDGIIAIQYRGKTCPIAAQPASVLASALAQAA